MGLKKLHALLKSLKLCVKFSESKACKTKQACAHVPHAQTRQEQGHETQETSKVVSTHFKSLSPMYQLLSLAIHLLGITGATESAELVPFQEN